jgi:hypothetical protein
MTDPHDDVTGGKRELLRHAIATLAYRGAKAIRAAPPNVADFQASNATRTPRALLAHIGDLLDWALSLAEGNQKWSPSTPKSWEEESARFFAALGRLDAFLASDRALGARPERLLQGPIGDALTHVGQLMMLRRLAGSPMRSENYAAAEIVAGRVSSEQAAPKFEFD